MSFRTIAMNCGAGTALALALSLTAAPAVAAADAPGAAYANAPANAAPLPAAPAMPAAPDMRPEWRPALPAAPASAVLLPDSRTRDAWLGECRRRTAYYYDNGGYNRHKRRHRHNDRDRGHYSSNAPGYDYCEAYFDDYYRTYSQRGYAYSAMVMMHPVAMAPVTTHQQGGQRQVTEVVTERYEPVRSRVIQHRRVIRDKRIPDKRIRVAP